ncbi:hypothetical protein JIG36_32585 [Actinoplanes sp. LDG1-06]|uniref:Uncharacterized protein n=1 Tax=Paractinoplanes ovalisporus TaxID=2810368 RepID=A0ABS2AK80_9ACTN|nr:hypothetical protein [Actinoplanes ovalisporus]MBM2620262.1 hypothetical protein [Actinoplanes ovalisporus]
MINSRSLVYGHAQLHDCLAFADGATAAEEARAVVALGEAQTWGEARAVVFAGDGWNPADPDYDEDADEHTDETPFDINELGAVIDGNWPKMVTVRALTLLPEDLRAKFGTVEFTTHNGEYLDIPLTAENDLVAALRERGFEVTRDDDLINALDGRTFSPIEG